MLKIFYSTLLSHLLESYIIILMAQRNNFRICNCNIIFIYVRKIALSYVSYTHICIIHQSQKQIFLFEQREGKRNERSSGLH